MASPHYRPKLVLVLVAYVTTVVSVTMGLSFAWLESGAYLAAFTLLTAFWVVMSRRGGPRSAREYQSYVGLLLAIAAIATGVAVVRLLDGHGGAALVASMAAVAFAGLAALIARIALFANRLNRLLDRGEQQRASGIGVTELPGGRRTAAVIVTDARVIVAARDGALPRLVAQRGRDRVTVTVAEHDAYVTLDENGAPLSVRGISRGQGLSLAEALRTSAL